MDWYFYTADGKGIDIRQPDNRMIVGRDIRPTARGMENALPIVLEEYRRRCDSADRADSAKRKAAWVAGESAPLGAEHRGVWLCNAEDYSGDEFRRRHAVFRTRSTRSTPATTGG
jgi:hypothetical protein